MHQNPWTLVPVNTSIDPPICDFQGNDTVGKKEPHIKRPLQKIPEVRSSKLIHVVVPFHNTEDTAPPIDKTR